MSRSKSKEIKLQISGKIEEEGEEQTFELIDVLSLPDDINNDDGNRVNVAIHIKDSIQLRKFCINHKLPLFNFEKRHDEEESIRYTKFNDLWLFAYKSKYDT